MDITDWRNLTFPERDDIIVTRMHERGMDPQRFNAPLHDLADAWCAYVTDRLRGETGDGAAVDAETALATIDGICVDLDLLPYSASVYGDALETAHAMMMQAYNR